MLWIISIVIALIALIWLVKRTPKEQRPKVYLSLAIGCIALLLLRFGQPVFALLVASVPILTRLLSLLGYAKWIHSFFSGKKPTNEIPEEAFSLKEAYEILELSPPVTEKEVIVSHKRLMKSYHPDHGGNEYFAKKLNTAKDMLLQACKKE